MSKTVDLQIEKSLALLRGLHSNLRELAPKGVTLDNLNILDEKLKSLKIKSEECDILRDKLKIEIRDLNSSLTSVKEMYSANKKIIKQNYVQEEWQRFGVTDKR